MENQNWIKAYVLQILPAFAIVIYILGFCYYIPYYHTFGINIISYITLSEILVTTLIPVVIAIFLICMYGFISLVLDPPMKASRRKLVKASAKHLDDFKAIPEPRNRFLRGLRKCLQFLLEHRAEEVSAVPLMAQVHRQLSIAVAAILALGFAIYLFFNVNARYEEKVVILSIGVVVCFSLAVLYYRKLRMIGREKVRRYANAASLTFLLPFALYGIGYFGYQNAKTDKSGVVVQSFEIRTMAGDYSSQEGNLYYVGDCANAYFLYDRNGKSAVIVNKANVVSATLSDADGNNPVRQFMKRLFEPDEVKK